MMKITDEHVENNSHLSWKKYRPKNPFVFFLLYCVLRAKKSSSLCVEISVVLGQRYGGNMENILFDNALLYLIMLFSKLDFGHNQKGCLQRCLSDPPPGDCRAARSQRLIGEYKLGQQ